MKQLKIKLKGEVQSSNFNEWKKDLIIHIKSVNTELTTDNDFAIATQHVKLFKQAEKSLKEAKQSAIEQAKDIQELFAAIDEVSEEARRTRLLLERQIKARKLEIKEELIDSGLSSIRAFIDQQSEDLQKINHSLFLDRNRFKLAIKGKAGIRGVQRAIDILCHTIKTEILQKEKEVIDNGLAIDSLPPEYRLLFQDRDQLISLTRQEVGKVINDRISLYKKEKDDAEIEKEDVNIAKSEEGGSTPDKCFSNNYLEKQKKENFRIIIDIFAPKDNAVEIARSIRKLFINNKAISNILFKKLPIETIGQGGCFNKQDKSKDFVVLATSIKHGQTCIAGREIAHINSELEVGSWIRPVSDHDEGALSSHEIMLENGSAPQFLDIINIAVKNNTHNQTQPENWLIAKTKWKKIGRVRIDTVFNCLIENPPTLWTSVFCPADRISSNEYIRNEYSSSLCIIQPESFSMEICTIFNAFEGRMRKRRRGKFLYNGVNYDLAITDPSLDKKYFSPFPGINDGIKQVSMDAEKCLLCISLAPEFNGYHYKLIAKVIENE